MAFALGVMEHVLKNGNKALTCKISQGFKGKGLCCNREPYEQGKALYNLSLYYLNFKE